MRDDERLKVAMRKLTGAKGSNIECRNTVPLPLLFLYRDAFFYLATAIEFGYDARFGQNTGGNRDAAETQFRSLLEQARQKLKQCKKGK
jgi:hypothetical protein